MCTCVSACLSTALPRPAAQPVFEDQVEQICGQSPSRFIYISYDLLPGVRGEAELVFSSYTLPGDTTVVCEGSVAGDKEGSPSPLGSEGRQDKRADCHAGPLDTLSHKGEPQPPSVISVFSSFLTDRRERKKNRWGGGELRDSSPVCVCLWLTCGGRVMQAR